MRIPKSISVCDKPLTIRLEDNLYDGKVKVDGIFKPASGEIVIDSGSNAESVLVHELIHAILAYSIPGDWLSSRREEKIVLALEHELHRLYRRRHR